MPKGAFCALLLRSAARAAGESAGTCAAARVALPAVARWCHNHRLAVPPHFTAVAHRQQHAALATSTSNFSPTTGTGTGTGAPGHVSPGSNTTRPPKIERRGWPPRASRGRGGTGAVDDGGLAAPGGRGACAAAQDAGVRCTACSTVARLARGAAQAAQRPRQCGQVRVSSSVDVARLVRRVPVARPVPAGASQCNATASEATTTTATAASAFAFALAVHRWSLPQARLRRRGRGWSAHARGHEAACGLSCAPHVGAGGTRGAVTSTP